MTEATQVKFPYRYDVVGSLLRTQALKEAHKQFKDGAIDEKQLRAIQHAETKKIVSKQVELGLKDVTDGEFNRSWWHLDFLWGLGGVGHYDYHKSYKFHGSKTRTDNADLVDKITPTIPSLIVSSSCNPLPRMASRLNKPSHRQQ